MQADISCVIHIVSKFKESPRHLHIVAVLHIIQNLLGSLSRGLFFTVSNSLQLTAYSDRDWADFPDFHKSLSGWRMFLGDALIS